MPAPISRPAVARVRAFNRFYTRQIGVLAEGHLDSPFSLAEVRVLYELAHREEPTATELARDLELDPGYLSRILKRLERGGLAQRRPGRDARHRHLRLTRKGRAAFQSLDRRASGRISGLLAHLSGPQGERLIGAMGAIEELLSPASPGAGVELRSPRPGDLGWVVERHGVLYHEEFGWDERFEGLVAGIIADFVREFDPTRDRCWIAEQGGLRLGCVFLVHEPGRPDTSRLRCLLVDPAARGHGLGRRLVAECLAFARGAGYRRVVLWTNDMLDAARHLYEEAGFVRTGAEPHARFGHGLIGETWELELPAASAPE